MGGFFVTFEGGEGTGKSTQIKLLAQRLEQAPREVVVTREPGGTMAAESIRALLVSGETNSWSSKAEALLNNAARESHLNELIRPALTRGAIVLCDRFMDSTRAYQGFAGHCEMSLIDTLEAAVVGQTRPDLTLVFDLDPDVGLARARSRGEVEDRYERKGLEFHQRLRAGFLEIARNNPKRCRVVDANASIADISANVLKLVNQALGHG